MSLVVAQIDTIAAPQEVWDLVMDPSRTLEWVTIARPSATSTTGRSSRASAWIRRFTCEGSTSP